ncbi:adenylate/guanylate cyclase domain-containing protein [Rhizobium sp. BK377]|uniref:adenylate/guanylate cyclase domain-containing protein n=1 Tax=Rhizobium sp. BK377 TaxID=2587058 RepID=UPI00162091FE|nr:adenylate/guanylate cyclase domain-containing protein [Rhizobium sp. BK377]MBB3461988.1 class 3 adenylate cyclase [Rhizobium sp. BK377]
MALTNELHAQVAAIFKETWTTRDGKVVPAPEDLKHSNDAVQFDRATVLYADLSGSTALVDTRGWQFAAEIYKAYLYCAGRLIKSHDGVITSYDGDRVMGVFIGDYQSTNAVKCALRINWAIHNVINPALKKQYDTDYVVRQVVGVDTSSIRAARTGVRGDNDIVWVGRAANYAAKLTEIKSERRTWITKDVYDRMHESARISNGQNMWNSYRWDAHDNQTIYGSTWTWSL